MTLIVMHDCWPTGGTKAITFIAITIQPEGVVVAITYQTLRINLFSHSSNA